MKSNKNKAEKPAKKKTSYNVVSLLELFVIVSVAYMTVVIYMGTEGLEPKIMTAPAVVWAAVKTLIRFSK